MSDLLREKRFLLDFFDALDHFIIVLDKHLDVICFNKFARIIFNLTQEEVLGEAFFSLLEKYSFNFPIEKTALSAIVLNAIRIEDWLAPNGDSLSLKLAFKKIFNGDYYIFSGINTTQLRQYQRDCRTHQTNLFNILENLPQYVYWKDSNLAYKGCNRNVSDYLGLPSPYAVIGKTDEDFGWSKDRVEALKLVDEQILKKGKISVVEDVIPHQDGTLRVMLTSKQPLRDENGSIMGILGISTDITDQQEMQDSLDNARLRAEEADRVKTQFIRNMEHDLRTPFNGIYSTSAYLIESEQDPMRKELLQGIHESAKELLDYCNAILEFSKTTQSERPLVVKRFSMQEQLDTLSKMLRPSALDKSLEFMCICERDVPQILMGDAYRLLRILINLVGNAIKFTAEGKVIVQVRKLKLKNEQEVIIGITVQDTGIGIPAEKCQFIYERFARLEEANKGFNKGLGLGLSIVKQFMDDMRGELSCETEENKGTTFICVLPFKIPLIELTD